MPVQAHEVDDWLGEDEEQDRRAPRRRSAAKRIDCPQALLARRRCSAPISRAMIAVEPVPIAPLNSPTNQKMYPMLPTAAAASARVARQVVREVRVGDADEDVQQVLGQRRARASAEQLVARERGGHSERGSGGSSSPTGWAGSVDDVAHGAGMVVRWNFVATPRIEHVIPRAAEGSRSRTASVLNRFGVLARMTCFAVLDLRLLHDQRLRLIRRQVQRPAELGGGVLHVLVGRAVRSAGPAPAPAAA